jgi:hypothetical protein
VRRGDLRLEFPRSRGRVGETAPGHARAALCYGLAGNGDRNRLRWNVSEAIFPIDLAAKLVSFGNAARLGRGVLDSGAHLYVTSDAFS